jgi:glycosyltransferase involved in cell wall biosynthesis
MAEPLVSVIIPTFNRAHCVGKAIDSVRSQTHQNTEIAVLDDGSTDGTRDLIEESYRDDPRVRYYFHENRGVTATRNRGITLARGDFVGLLDSDDTWSPWKLELQLACMREFPEIGMVWTDMEAVGPDGNVLSRAYLQTMYHAYRWFSREELFPESTRLAEIAPGLASVVGDRRLHRGEIFSQMIMGNLVHTSTVLIRRDRLEKVRGFNEELRVSGEDYDFHLRTCKEGPVGWVDLSTIRYQTGLPDRLTHQTYRVQAAMNCLKTILPWIEHERPQIKLSDRMLRLRLADVHSWIGDSHLEAGESAKARVHLRRSLMNQPWQPAVFKLLLMASLPDGVRQRLRQCLRSLKRRAAGKGQRIAAAGVP